MADAIAGAQTHGKSSKGKSDFASILDSVLSSQAAQPIAIPQDNTAKQKQAALAQATDTPDTILSSQAAQQQVTVPQDNTAKQKHTAFAQATDVLNAATAANGDTTSDQSANANSALAAKIVNENVPDTKNTTPAVTVLHKHAASAKAVAFERVKAALNNSAAAQGNSSEGSADAMSALAAKLAGTAANTNSTTPQSAAQQTVSPQTIAPQAAVTTQSFATAQAAKQAGGQHAAAHVNPKHAAQAAATQAKLVSALAQAANAPAKIVGSDGQTAASSDSKGTPATADAQTSQAQPAQSETPAETANILAAMQTNQPVVTTVAPNADKTEATVTPRTMTQLEKAALGNTAQQALHSSAPAAKTEVQALSMPADAKSATPKDSSDTQTGSGQKQSHGSGESAANITANVAKTSDTQSQTASAPATPAAPQPTTNAPVTQQAANTSNAAVTSAASAVSNAAQPATVAPTTIATTLQVAQHAAASSTASPDLAALGVTIAAKSKNGQNEFNIRMDPADLGRVDVRLSVDAAGKAQAHLTAEKPQTLELLQRDSQTLERSLKDSGLDLANSGLNFSLKGEQQSSTPTFIARNRALSIASVQTDTISSSSSTSTAPGDSRLDIRV